MSFYELLLENGSQQAGSYFKIQKLSDTEDLYNLPGYRPRANHVQSKSYFLRRLS